ncbi:hypothetical protein QKT71_gp3 [Chalcocoris rutilans mononega-like virus 2]|uniref:Uncharacterized protein n=1 Tax=Chalcocoris rutilans mononega-like virus 2 TaxID=2973795 RepID=A0A916LL21_9VIRU|nr:hypothetical protein QKT71_gp3 [Chalcocoris rutilans mononega-like virus 2]
MKSEEKCECIDIPEEGPAPKDQRFCPLSDFKAFIRKKYRVVDAVITHMMEPRPPYLPILSPAIINELTNPRGPLNVQQQALPLPGRQDGSYMLQTMNEKLDRILDKMGNIEKRLERLEKSYKIKEDPRKLDIPSMNVVPSFPRVFNLNDPSTSSLR